MTTLSRPMFEPSETPLFEAQRCSRCGTRGNGAHYNLFHITGGILSLRCFFESGEANEMNFVLFSTSGVHGSYTTIEEIEASLEKYGDKEPPEGEEPDDWTGNELTVLIVQPRICCLRYGNIKVILEDIPYLKKLRSSSWNAAQKIGATDPR